MTEAEPTIVANFEMVKQEPIQATFTITKDIKDLNYTHNQDVPADTWVIDHNLNKYPSVTIVNSAGEVVQADVQYINSNKIQIEFIGAFAGIAYLN